MTRDTSWVVTKLLVLTLCFSSCSSSYEMISDVTLAQHDPTEELMSLARSLPKSLEIPYDIKVIRTHFHFFNNLDSTLNYNPSDAMALISVLLKSANARMADNDKMHLPRENKTPVQDTYIRYALAHHQGRPAVFHHYESEPQYFIKSGKKSNRYDRKMIKDYIVSRDSVINVFMMPFDPEQLATGVQKLEITGIALGHVIKLPGLFQSKRPAWEYAGCFNHEIGHILGLRHTWSSNDGCDDTPYNDNCWNKTSEPPCDELGSNNLMDYNAHQSAITPCQIARMHTSLVRPGSAAATLLGTEDCNHQGREYPILGYQRWAQPVRVLGDLVIKSGALLYITSHLQLAEGASIRVEKGGTLMLENATLYNYCGKLWRGIEKHKDGAIYTIGGSNLFKHVFEDSSYNRANDPS